MKREFVRPHAKPLDTQSIVYTAKTDRRDVGSHPVGEGGTRALHASTPVVDGCPVCAGLHGIENEFVAGASHGPGSVAAAGEAVVDSLGFCGDHGTVLAQQRRSIQVTVRVLRSATERAIDLLTNEKRNCEYLFELFFASDRSCPVCKLHDRQVARKIHRLLDHAELQRSSRWLCFPHYRDVAYAMQSPALPTLAHAQVKLLESVVAEIGTVAYERQANAADASVTAEMLSWVLRVVVGDTHSAYDYPRSGRGNAEVAEESRDWHGDPFDADRGCIVCAEVVRAGERWIGAVKSAARIGQDLWTVLPTCTSHVIACTRLGNQNLAVMAARYVAGVELAALQRGTKLLARDNANRQVAAKSVFYRRKSPAHILGQQRKMITRLPRCPACEGLIVAQTRAVGKLVQTLPDARRRNVSERFGRLCMKHFAAVYLLAPRGEPRSALVGFQLEKLRQLRSLLAQLTDFSDPATVDRDVRDTMRAWSTTMR